MKSSKLWLLVWLPVAALLGVVVARWWLPPHSAALQTGTLLPAPREIGPFSLTAENGRPFTQVDFKGRWSLIFTGYTHCPDVCPTTLATLKTAVRDLGADAAKLQVVFLSVDPGRDTPQALESYVHYFNPAFRGVTGPTAELDRLAPRLGFVYTKVPGPTPDAYEMDHSAALILVNPQAQVAAYFSPPFKAALLAADLKQVLEPA